MHPIIDAIQALSRAKTIEAIAAVVRTTARSLTNADGATFVLKDGAQCYYMDEDAIAPLWKGKRFPASACISGWVMEHRKATAIDDIYRDSRIPHDAYRPTFVKSLVMTPIRSADPIGAIGVYWSGKHAAPAAELELLQALADSTATAMESAYLHANLQQQVAERTRELELARQHAEQANEAKSRFLAAASHNLRQPIQTMSAVAAILDRVRDEAETRRHLESMSHAIRDMQSMLDTLLDLHQLEAGVLQPNLKDTKLDGVFARLRSEFAYLANSKSLRLEIPQAAPPVHTDPHLLQEILRNFLSNALKYTARGSVCIECSVAGDEVCIAIADTGPGIPPQYLENIFKAFYRSPDARAEGHQGVGLGLSIADQLARVLDHRIEVQSHVGAGSRFSILAPRARAQVAEVGESTSPAPPRRAGAGRVLYMEDHPAVRHALCTLLQLEGYEVWAAASSEEALRILETLDAPPQLIISDFHLPAGETGEQAVARVRQALGVEAPALLLTGRVRDSRTPESILRVLHKPVDPNVLLEEIATALRSPSRRQRAATACD